MRIGDYYVLTRRLRTDGTMEFIARTERATADRQQAVREARGNALRLRSDGRGFGVEVHEVVAVDDGGSATAFVSVFAIDEGSHPRDGRAGGAAL